ncbi:MAG: group II intron reverse transcriptase/maturase [Candidatus Dehalobacter alkaniphilus]
MTKQKKLRHSEYYDLQPTFDMLYADSGQGKTFTKLMKIISCEENIRLAYRNIKKNGGSNTAGTDGKSIADIEKMPVEEYVHLVQRKLIYYKPKPVRRVEIPKPNGKMRPLGIPTIVDRLVQQCILQVMEPICEAKFFERSNGFRPNRSAENAIAQCYKMIQLQNLHFVVDVDIKGFFDHVNHTKLIKQIWHMGIRDKKLLCIIREMLKAPIVMPDGKTVYPTEGTPQGGILSPLLSNIVLNELDWWIASQWENMPTRYEYSCEIRPNGTKNKSSIYGALRNTTQLKEVYIVRYADDFKLFCRKRSDAEKVFIATKQWLKDRLKLDISEEKSKIINLKRHYSEFLGFELKAFRKRKGYVVKSHMTPKAIARETEKLIAQVKQIAHAQDRDDEVKEVTLYNSMVIGVHNYYRFATMIATDCEQIHRNVSTVMKNRLYGRLTKKGQINEVYIRKHYGDSKQIRYVSSKTVCPVGYIKTQTPMFKKKKVCKYTPEGREEIHINLKINTTVMLMLMRIKEPRRSVEYMDNRISLYAAQYGRCAVTGKELWIDEIHCHHKVPLHRGGTDEYNNLVIVHRDVHLLIHVAAPETIAAYLNLIQPDKKALEKINNLRLLAGSAGI